jgi:hypothetical protein
MIVVRWLRAFVRFWSDVVVGEDWTVAHRPTPSR